MNTHQQLWDNILVELKKKIGEATFNDVFKDCKTVHKFENDHLFIIVPNALIKFRIESFFVNILNDIVPYVSDKKIGFRFLRQEDIVEETKPKISSPDEFKPIGRTLSTLYRFDNFEVGESNRYAFVTSMKVARK